jgi:serine/threonine-protein kinase HipA
MKFSPVKIVRVYYKPRDKKILVGRLALKLHRIFFEYDSDFLELGLNLSPLKLPFKPGVIPSNDFVFEGLFGVFNDSLPDGWGRLLLDRNLLKHNLNPGSLSVLDRLCFVGSRGMGALIYEPEAEPASIISDIDLDKVAAEVKEFQEYDNDAFVEDLLNLGGSSAGARPKILMNLDNTSWIVKFYSSNDLKDIGKIEYAYHLMAKEAGLEIPEAKLFPSKKSGGFFGSKRFDRTCNELIHMHSMSGLLHADHRTPSLDYETMMKATMYLTRDMNQCKKLFRQCVFNVLSYNRDDHAKNFSFLMDNNGSWHLSPAYDLTFSSGPSGEHCSTIMGEGKNPGIAHLLELANISNINKSEVIAIIDEVKSAVSKWPIFAKNLSINAASASLIASTIKNQAH